MEPSIQYAKTSDGVSIAYSSMGDGPPLVRASVAGWNHAQRDWVTYSQIYGPLAERFRVVLYDCRGTGLSDRAATQFSMETMVQDLEAVVERAGLSRFPLLAFLYGAQIAIAYAATRPERVTHLVLVDGFARSDGAELPAIEIARMALEKDWVLYTEMMARVLMGLQETEYSRRLAEHMRACVEPQVFRAIVEATEEYDVSGLLGQVRCPTLVVQNERSPVLAVSRGQQLAAGIPDARFLPVDDLEYASLPALVEEFVGIAPLEKAQHALPSGTAVILFADIANSTALTERLGDAAFREKARELDEALRRAINSNGGTAVDGKLLGDGVLATFGAAREAIECAAACHTAAAGVELKLHIGIHAGDVIREANNVYGGAVNIASRVADESAAGETLVSQTVRDLARTSAGVSFEDRGERELKGVGEPVRVWAVRKQG